jgi:hypothetical protein
LRPLPGSGSHDNQRRNCSIGKSGTHW